MFNAIIDGTKKAMAGLKNFVKGKAAYVGEKHLDAEREKSKLALDLRKQVSENKRLQGCSHRGRRTCHARGHGTQDQKWMSPMDIFILANVHKMAEGAFINYFGIRAAEKYASGIFLKNSGAHGKTLTKRALRYEELAKIREAGRVKHARLITSQHAPLAA